MVELLAPAKNKETGIIAIDHGADAVYIGANKFGARSAAGNSVSDISKLVKYAHKYNAKVLVALNTILYDHELEEAEKLVTQIYETGADALIIQDMALLEMNLPPIVLHASTQANNYSVEKIQFLEKCGIKRVVLARELSIPQIKTIRENTNCELEFFVGGALCVSLSGQCYLSQKTGNRSANRGACAQPCRLDYNLVDGDGRAIIKNKHLLSLKDMDLTAQLSHLIDAGIMSLKIEGRLKDANYVANTTAWFRKKIDELLTHNTNKLRTSSGISYFTFEPDITKTFNRQQSDYFAQGRKPAMVNMNSPKSMGMKIGTITSKGHNYIEIQNGELLKNGDGICYLNKTNNLTGTNISKIEKNRLFINDTSQVKVGNMVFRNFDIEFNKELKHNKTKRLIAVTIVLGETTDGFKIRATDCDNINAEYTINSDKIVAENKINAAHSIKKQLNKSGDSIFKPQNIIVETEELYFIKASVLNEMRRNVFEQLEAKRIEQYKRDTYTIEATSHSYPKKTISYLENVSNAYARKFYERHGCTVEETAYELKKGSEDERLMTSRYCIKYEMEMCPKFHNNKKTKQLKEPLFLENANGKFKLVFDCKACMMYLYAEK